MIRKLPVADGRWPLDFGAADSRGLSGKRKSEFGNQRAFSLVEVMLVVTLLSLIVLALMAVFNGTQKAFRASITQTDVLEGSRAAMDLMASDLRGLTPSGGVSNGPVNFAVFANGNNYQPLTQDLPGTSVQRTNLLNYFFALGRVNTKWTGVGYVVNATNNSTLYPLYRFYAETNVSLPALTLYNLFRNEIVNSQWTNNNLSHVIDGVVHLTVRAQDPDGHWINDIDSRPYSYTNAMNTVFFYAPDGYGEAQFFMFSNTVPAAVELELGVMEDATLARAESLSAGAFLSPTVAPAQWKFLQGQAGRVHVFRQRVTIPNVDPTAYQ